MKCKQCGIELEDGAVFCQSCGAKVEAPAEEKPAAEEPKAEEKPAEEPKAEEKPAEEAPKAEEKTAEAPKAEEAAPAAAQPQVQPQAAPADAAPKAKSKVLPIILIAAAALVVLILAVVGIKMIGGSKKGDTSTVVAYVSHDTLCVIMDATAKEPKVLEVCDLDIDLGLDSYYGEDYVPDSLVRWSPDEKTLYFFNDVDGGNATLCKVAVSKLGKDKSKNESKIVEIDDKVMLNSLVVLDDGRVLYIISKNNKLMIYNGKESVEVDKDVDSVRVVDGGKAFVYLSDGTDNGSYTLNYANSKLETTELDDDVRYISAITDNDIYYVRMDEDTWTSSLCVTGFDGKKSEEISDNLDNSGIINDNGFYYTERVEETVCLYDYIIDPYEKDDENAVEPVYPDYSAGFVPSTETEAFDEYKQERIKKKYDDALDYMESNCSIYTYGEVNYYYIWNSDDWNEYYYDISADKYYRYDSDTFYAARDRYNEERDEWYAIQNRISLRNSLREYTFDPGYVSLNYYHDGKSEELVSECADVELVYFSGKQPMAVYSLPSEDSVEKIKIDDITYAYEAYDRIFGYDNNNEYGELFVASGSETDISLDIEASIYDTMISEDDGLFAIVVYVKDKNDEPEKQVLLYNMKGTSFTLNEKFDDEAEVLSAFKNGVVYFLKNTSSDGSEADLYYYDGKENTKIIKNVSLYSSGLIYDNGSILCFDGADAILYDKNGEQIVKLGYIESLYSDINHISDKKIIFYSEGKLRYYNGKETVKVANSVDNAWFNSTNSGTYLSVR